MILLASLWLLVAPAAALGPARAAPAAKAPGGYVVVGRSQIDPSAPGAPTLLSALSFEPQRAVLGVFTEPDDAVVNAFAHSTFGVDGHIDAVPPQRKDDPTIGGYTYILKPSGERLVRPSGSRFKPITSRLKRNLDRYFGVSPAGQSWLGRLGRALMRGWDRAWDLLLKNGGAVP